MINYLRFSAMVSLLASTGLDAGTPAIPDSNLAPVESDWNFRIAPYGWLPAVDGDVEIGRFGAPAEISFSDTLDHLDMAVMLVAEASYKRWSLNTDFVYSDFSNEASRAGLPGGLLLRSIHFEYTQWVLTQTLGYRVIEADQHRMDVFAGARITSFDGTLTGRFALGFELQRSADDIWTDPIIGIRGRHELGQGFFCRYNGDIGGFGVSSDLTWQAFVGLGYDINPNLSVALGYRGMGTDYSEGPFTVDLIHHGPVIGLEFRF
jgi:hypothetical protein